MVYVLIWGRGIHFCHLFFDLMKSSLNIHEKRESEFTEKLSRGKLSFPPNDLYDLSQYMYSFFKLRKNKCCTKIYLEAFHEIYQFTTCDYSNANSKYHCANDIPLLEFKHLCHELWSKKHNFVTIDLTSTTTNGKYRQNFNRFFFPTGTI